MYRDIPERLRELLEPIVQDHGLELVDAPLAGGRGGARLQVVVDTPEGDGRVDVESCARVSREVGHALDASDVIDGTYTLEVCSPGVDRTLAREVDFSRAVGRRVSIETLEPVAGRRRFKGELVAFDGECARLATDRGDTEIPFSGIARAKSFYPFAQTASRG